MGAAVATLGIVGVYLYFAQTADAPVAVPGESGKETAATQPTFGWSFRELPEGEFGQPNTEVSLHVTESGMKSYVIGTYPLGCSESQAVVTEPEPNRVSTATCWWAGGGIELGVFHEDGNYVVREAEISEGIEGEPIPPKVFKALITLE